MILSAESIKELLNGCACTKLRNFVTVAFLLLGYVILQTLFHHPTTNRVVSASRVNTKTKAAIGRQTRIKTLRVPTVCANESCRKKFDEQINIRENIFPIPKIRHILWRSELVPKYFSTHLKSWERVHPNWSYVLWRDRDLEPFVAANYPKLLGQFRSLKQQIMRVDMIRYMLLLKPGAKSPRVSSLLQCCHSRAGDALAGFFRTELADQAGCQSGLPHVGTRT
ncbi:hypothetical protein BOX15_Mlig000088g4 [Macrostomum lignano]|uniref:Uncharacterized protein n=1 Tax=Macrostomum lignano TaxID=282301 RepID=A0A267FL82_9PLAT|nr:hypothetical protein BOX15_Mlig000088g4 [Macrostomum lignano]